MTFYEIDFNLMLFSLHPRYESFKPRILRDDARIAKPPSANAGCAMCIGGSLELLVISPS